MSNKNTLSFSKGNAKLDTSIYTFSLPAGFSCPGAMHCLEKADPDTGHIIAGPHREFSCYAARAESRFPQARESRHRNFRLLIESKGVAGMADLIMTSLPPKAGKVRIHESGDFFSQDYFDAWLEVAHAFPDITFYAYTKSLRFWVMRKDEIPGNLLLTASRGGKFDYLIDAHKFISASVIFHPDEAKGRPIDHDDSHAYDSEKHVQDFCHLIHGSQAKDSKGAAAIKRLKEEGIKHNYGPGKHSIGQSGAGDGSPGAQKIA